MLNGRLLNDRYQIKETIGGGGMANVYLARDTILKRDVAIKVLRLEYANDDEFIARFDREAQSATSLSHPNIVNIYDVGEEDQILYMVMEYVDGMTLKEYIQTHGPIDVQKALDIMKQLTSAIAHAHANDIVHRDIKPQNILIDTYGQAKVTDFGIAIALSATSLTQTNSILGSVHYLSPEQARGGTATKKSDIYSIGIVLFELLTGRLPFSGQTPVSIALKHLQSDTPSVRRFNQDVPQSVENIVLKATAKDPFHRYDTVYDIEEAIDTALDPGKINEAVYSPPVEAGEETKAIPIITDNQTEQNPDQDTLVHQTTGSTKNYPSDEKSKKKSKKDLKKKKPKRKRRKKWIIIAVILFILLASGVAAFFLLQPNDVTVPNVVDMESDEAIDELESLDLITEQELIYSEEIEEGFVVRTDPQPERTVKEGSMIKLFVSQGKETVAFDDYVGRDYSQVERLLEEDYDEIISYDKHSDRPVGEIITQIQPNSDSDVVPSETSVIFEVSIGPESVSLNDLAGMTEEAASDYLDNQNLTMNRVEESSDSTPEGEVIRQEPEADTELEEGSTVNVYVSSGPEEQPPASHSITYTVPYSLEDEESEENEENEEDEEDVEEDGDEEEPVEQTVRIYIDDMNNDIDEVNQEEEITEDTEYTFTLTIAPNDDATYRIMRDDEVLTEETISYEDEEGE
ncbi:Stk1 family PASTA domain-containing Ser/Thr kinase [Virgibacillus sp. CBA3643]|uniref:Stk1 family PASTA domain-containing Ser/Thr kinase n=1 Tax=Virgibacillus sp. CBA3643 TaxID=2942278 RepID=UPI0035A375CD